MAYLHKEPNLIGCYMSDPFRRAARIADVELSEILQISEAAAAMKKAGRDVISLGTGETNFL